MVAGALNPTMGTFGIVVTRKKPGHFVALTENGRIDAHLAQSGVSLTAALGRRSPISIKDARQGPTNGVPMTQAGSTKSVDPFDITVAMPALDGEPCVSDTDRDVWSKFRIVYDVSIEAPPFKVVGVLLLLPSQDPMALTERGSELFLPVFAPSVQFNGTPIIDTPRDGVLVNRSHIRRVNATMRHDANSETDARLS